MLESQKVKKKCIGIALVLLINAMNATLTVKPKNVYFIGLSRSYIKLWTLKHATNHSFMMELNIK